MHFLFLDESGELRKPNNSSEQYFVVGGITIPASQWHQIQRELVGIKKSYKVDGELKWRFFGNKGKKHPLGHLDVISRDNLRTDMFGLINRYQSLKIICCVTNLNNAYSKHYINDIDNLYYHTYKPVTERFQYYLQDLSRAVGKTETGLIVCDQQSTGNKERRLRDLHQKLLDVGGSYTAKYENMVEGLMLAPSHHSVGIQLADLVVGAVGRYYNSGDERWFSHLESSWRKNPNTGKKEGWGLVQFPKEIQKDAESKISVLEPAIMTQSQR
jgi:hypothetical protein